MIPTTVGQLLVNEALPPDLHRYDHVLDKKGISSLMREVAEKHPDKYREIAQKLMSLGHYASQAAGTSLSLSAAMPPPEIRAKLEALRQQVETIGQSDLSDDEKEQKTKDLVMGHIEPIEKELLAYGLAHDNPFAMQVHSGSRGNATQLRQIMAGDMLVADHRDRVLPVPVLHGYVDGLDPVEYFAASYGARKGTVATKMATADAGFFSKQMNMAAHRLVVTEHDCGSSNGIPVKAADPDNAGSVLAVSAGGLPPGTTLTRKDLKALGDQQIMVRSPITCQAAHGLCAKCAGAREKGRLPDIGDNVGMAAAQAIGERMSQGMLCLAKGTLVQSADRTQHIAIEDIHPGDYVVGADLQGNKFPVEVLTVFANGIRPCVRTAFKSPHGSDEIELKSTLEHKLLVRNPDGAYAAVPVGMPGDMQVAQTLRKFLPTLAERVSQVSIGDVETFDIEVDHPDHLFVLANGLIVSNSSKHGGGAVGSKDSKAASGFDAINQQVQIPSSFKGAAVLAGNDGHVDSISDAPQGGKFVHVGGEQHYVPPDRDVRVSPGEVIEAGDRLTDGVSNPAEVVQHKGIGEGRLQFVSSFGDALRGAGIRPHRRNLEILARALVNHVKITSPEGLGEGLPDEIVPFDTVARHHEPREGSQVGSPKDATGHYLEAPVMHYSIGTRVTPRMVAKLSAAGVNEVTTHTDLPPFEPVMVRAMEHGMRDPNPISRLSGSYLEKGMLDSVQRARSGDRHSTSFIPALAQGTELGTGLGTKGTY